MKTAAAQGPAAVKVFFKVSSGYFLRQTAGYIEIELLEAGSLHDVGKHLSQNLQCF